MGITRAIRQAPRETQVKIEIDGTFDRDLNRLNGTYISREPGIYTKQYTHYRYFDGAPYFRAREEPQLMSKNGFWQLVLGNSGRWIVRHAIDAAKPTVPPGGAWDVAAERVPFSASGRDAKPKQGDIWLMHHEDKDHLVKVDRISGPSRMCWQCYTELEVTYIDPSDRDKDHSRNLSGVRLDSVFFSTRVLLCDVKVVEPFGCGNKIEWSKCEPVPQNEVDGFFAAEWTDMGCRLDMVGMEDRPALLKKRRIDVPKFI